MRTLEAPRGRGGTTPFAVARTLEGERLLAMSPELDIAVQSVLSALAEASLVGRITVDAVGDPEVPQESDAVVVELRGSFTDSQALVFERSLWGEGLADRIGPLASRVVLEILGEAEPLAA